MKYPRKRAAIPGIRRIFIFCDIGSLKRVEAVLNVLNFKVKNVEYL